MKRDPTIDILKGIAIVLVVVGHTDSGLSHFIYLFHMSVFFVATGFLYSDKEPKVLITKKIKSLYIPYVVFNTIFLVLNNYFLKIGFYLQSSISANYSVNRLLSIRTGLIEFGKIMLFSGGTTFGGALWFLRVMFISSLMYYSVSIFIRKFGNEKQDILRILISLLISLFGFFLGEKNISLIMNIPSCCSVLWLYEFGRQFKRFVDMKPNVSNSIKYIAIVGFFLLMILNAFISIDIGNNKYTSVSGYLIASLSGWIVLFAISDYLKNRFFGNLLMLVGKNSLYIMSLHFLTFKGVSYFLILISDLSKVELARFPTIDTPGFWILYTLVGVIIPTVLGVSIHLLKE